MPRRCCCCGGFKKIKILSAEKLSRDPNDPCALQVVGERDAVKTQLETVRGELGAAKSNANALDVSVLQLTASTERLKVRSSMTHPFFFFFWFCFQRTFVPPVS